MSSEKIKDIESRLTKLESEVKLIRKEIVDLLEAAYSIGKYKRERCIHFKNGVCNKWKYKDNKEPVKPSLAFCAICHEFSSK